MKLINFYNRTPLYFLLNIPLIHYLGRPHKGLFAEEPIVSIKEEKSHKALKSKSR